MKLIFLDIDGVLNHLAWWEQMEREKVPYPRIWCLAPECVAALNWLLAYSGASIVVTSTWRTMWKLSDLRGHFRREGVRDPPIIAAIPDLSGRMPSGIWRSETRGKEIRAWMAGYPRPVESHVVIDDDVDDDMPQPVVQTDARGGGLTMEKAQEALDALARGKAAELAGVLG